MTVSVSSVIAAILDERPYQPGQRPHLLLFFAQGHYLSGTGAPLFAEPILAIPDGVHVDFDPDEATVTLNNRQLGFIDYAVQRYGDMRVTDLQSLVQISSAWQLARRHKDDPRIEWAWITDWFRRPAERSLKPSAKEVEAFERRRKARMGADL